MPRRIAVVTTSRADYSHLHWVLRDLEAHPSIDLKLIATGAQLSHEFGAAVSEIEDDGFTVDERVECLLSSDTDVGMAKTIGVATLGLAEVLGRLRPDMLLLIADRYEMLAPASVALALRIPIAHIEGGDVSEGAIDDAVRNALTKMSHLHFTPTETAKRRVIAMGEEPWRVQRTGAPSLDHLVRNTLIPSDKLQQELGVTLADDAILVAHHPLTLAQDTLCEIDALFGALERLSGQVLFCFPNADAGSRELFSRAAAFCEGRAAAHLFVNLHPLRYWSLLGCAAVMLGNSSSGIMESPSLALPCVNVGMRQQGRERADNIIDVEADADAILHALERARDEDFKQSLLGMVNPYGDGSAARRIVETIAATELGEKLLIKKAIVL
jgi:UDP-N-acetylglucosamine 2-epimerase (non-hydrolysing)/GDP/UDP-N,N'-diacetylbacillosamine 2-epimerase (hydrolysing)